MGYDVFSRRCGCGRILARLEQCTACTDKRRAQAVALAGPQRIKTPEEEIVALRPAFWWRASGTPDMQQGLSGLDSAGNRARNEALNQQAMQQNAGSLGNRVQHLSNADFFRAAGVAGTLNSQADSGESSEREGWSLPLVAFQASNQSMPSNTNSAKLPAVKVASAAAL